MRAQGPLLRYVSPSLDAMAGMDGISVPVPGDGGGVPAVVDIQVLLQMMAQLMQNMQNMQQQQSAQHGGQGPSGFGQDGGRMPSVRSSLDEKFFRRVDKFNNTESTWKEWRVHFVSSVREASSELAAWMSQAEAVTEPIAPEKLQQTGEKCPDLSASLFNSC